MRKKILFITWDGASENYMEGLFMPIFQEIKKYYPIEFYILQFTWSDEKKIEHTRQAAKEMGIHYTASRILQKPKATLGSLFSLFTGRRKISRYIKKYSIDFVMPRSNFPAFMVHQISNKNFKIIFDADGLPIEERVDFCGLTQKSYRYKWLKKQETNMLLQADRVITRSQKSIDIHLKTIGEQYREKFSVVYNGRNTEFFKPNAVTREQKKKELGFKEGEKIFVYCGSLGPQYGWEEMMHIFKRYESQKLAKWLILTGNPQFALARIPPDLSSKILIKQIFSQEVPEYLNTADIAFAIRQPTFSMKGVAPIKLGEYLLMGLPTIASKGIGDSEALLQNASNCFLYDHLDSQVETKCDEWLIKIEKKEKNNNRDLGLQYFSLKGAAESYMYVLKTLK